MSSLRSIRWQTARSIAVCAGLLIASCSPVPVRLPPGNYHPPTYLAKEPEAPKHIIMLGNDITLDCTMSSPAMSYKNCVGGGFPFTVPAGKIFCMTHMYLMNKFPFDPLAYGGSMRMLYLQEPGVTATSHHPELHFDPPYPLEAGKVLSATISNAQSETQNIYALEQGFLVNEGQPCRR